MTVSICLADSPLSTWAYQEETFWTHQDCPTIWSTNKHPSQALAYLECDLVSEQPLQLDNRHLLQLGERRGQRGEGARGASGSLRHPHATTSATASTLGWARSLRMTHRRLAVAVGVAVRVAACAAVGRARWL